MSEGADEELRRGSSWARVRRGLRLLVIVWVVLTLVGVLTQMLTADLAMRARVGDEQAAATLALASFVHQVFYSLFALALAAAGLALTRAPPSSRAIPLALTAAGSFVLVFVLNLVVGVAARTPAETRATSPDTLQTYWTLLALARGIGVVALLATVLRLAAALGEPRRGLVSVIALVLAALDGGYPIYRLFVRDPASLAESSPWLHRGLVLGLQLAVAFFVIDTALRARRAAEPLARAEGAEPKTTAEALDEPGRETPVEQPERRERRDLGVGKDQPQSRAEQGVAAIGLALSVGMLPVWDAVKAGGFWGGLRLEVGSSFPTGAVGFALGGIVAGLLLFRALARSPYAARGVFGLALLGALGYLAVTAWDTALDRSRRMDAFAVCETMVGPDGEIVTPDPDAAKHRFEGPHLPNGQPCTSIVEARATHRAEYPGGSFRDGMIQISRHFPDDRSRFFQIPALTLLLLVISGVIVARAARLPRAKAERIRRDQTPKARSSEEDA